MHGTRNHPCWFSSIRRGLLQLYAQSGTVPYDGQALESPHMLSVPRLSRQLCYPSLAPRPDIPMFKNRLVRMLKLA